MPKKGATKLEENRLITDMYAHKIVDYILSISFELKGGVSGFKKAIPVNFNIY